MNKVFLWAITPLMRAYKAWDQWYTAKQSNKRWHSAYQRELDRLDIGEHWWYKPLVDNQIKHCRDSGSLIRDEEQALMIFKMGCAVARRLQPLTNIVGIQPLTGPVGLAFHLSVNGDATDGRSVVSVNKYPVGAAIRHLMAAVEYGILQDLKSLHGIDAIATAADIVANEIADEIIKEVLSDILRTATTVTKGDSRGIRHALNQLSISTRRAAGFNNFIICSLTRLEDVKNDMGGKFEPDNATYFNPIASTHVGMLDETMHFTTFAYVGMLDETIPVYVTTHFTDEIVVGYRGISVGDAGYIFCPYVPVAYMLSAMDPETFTPVMKFASRAGKWIAPTEDSAQTGGSYGYYRTVSIERDAPVDVNIQTSDNTSM